MSRFRTGGAIARKGNTQTGCLQPMLVLESSREPRWFAEIDIEDLAALIAIEMVVRRDVSVVTRRADGARHLVDLTVGDEYLEISIDGSERERRRLRQQCAMDVGGCRMRIALLDPMQDRLSLTRAIAARRGRGILGG